MEYSCSRCHTEFTAEGAAPPEHCPTCKAEAGLERRHATPLAMKLFGALLAGVALAAVVSTALALGSAA